MSGCGKKLAPGQWWNFCGETDMGQTAPVLCEECSPDGLKLISFEQKLTEEARYLREIKFVDGILPLYPEHREYLADLLTRASAMMRGWEGYAWKDGKYVDNIQAYFDAAIAAQDAPERKGD